MRKVMGMIFLAIGIVTFLVPQDAFCLAKRPRGKKEERVVIKPTTRPPDARDMQVATGEIPPIGYKKSD